MTSILPGIYPVVKSTKPSAVPVEILGKASALLETLTKSAATKQSRPAPVQEPDPNESDPAWGKRFNKS
ncbi:hypothetical protein AE0388_0268 [Brevibacterium linens]|uniref:Uncharacterized protein n=1 Tax=Brevibacterium linens TaxID=1703 RepID=A0A0B9AEP7_BRELN|nr:hypothetical protein AE0388_0268 [Brevibacterium linens]